MEYIIFTHNSWSPKHLFPTNGVHNIQSQEMESKAVTHERSSQQRLLTTYGVNFDFYFPSSSPIIHNTYKGEKESTAFTRYGVHSIDSQDMEHTAFSLVRWNTQYILMRHGLRSIYFWEMEYARILYEWWNLQHLPIRDRDSNIFTTQVVYIAFIHASWRPQHLSLRDGVHSIYSWEMASTAICHDWCSPNRLLSRDGFHIFYWRHMEYTLFTLEKGVHSIFTWYMQLLLSSFSL